MFVHPGLAQSEVAAPSHVLKRASLTVILAVIPVITDTGVFPRAVGIIPCTPKTPKPSPKSPDARSHFGGPGPQASAGAWLPRGSARPAP